MEVPRNLNRPFFCWISDNHKHFLIPFFYPPEKQKHNKKGEEIHNFCFLCTSNIFHDQTIISSIHQQDFPAENCSKHKVDHQSWIIKHIMYIVYCTVWLIHIFLVKAQKPPCVKYNIATLSKVLPTMCCVSVCSHCPHHSHSPDN